MFKTIYKAIDFAVTVLVLMIASTFCQPSEAMVYESLLTTGLQVRQTFPQETKQIIIILNLTFDQDVTNVQLLVDGLKVIDGVLALHVDGFNKRLFKVSFDPEIINQVELVESIYLLSTNPKLYGE